MKVDQADRVFELMNDVSMPQRLVYRSRSAESGNCSASRLVISSCVLPSFSVKRTILAEIHKSRAFCAQKIKRNAVWKPVIVLRDRNAGELARQPSQGWAVSSNSGSSGSFRP